MNKALEVQKQITDAMVAAILKGTPAWRKGWVDATNTGLPRNFVSNRLYTGINPLLLMLSGYQSQFWGSMDAWQKRAKAKVKVNESPTEIVFFHFVPRRDPKTKKLIMGPTGKPKMVPILRSFFVYNAEQMEPLSPETEAKLQRYLSQPVIANTDPDFEPAELLVKATGARISFGGDRASYDFGKDGIRLPPKRSFRSMSDYYETAFHELSHWAMHPTRVGMRKRYAEEYAFNELVAEISACFLCAHKAIPHADEMIESSKAYVGHWLKSMGNDTRYILEAATHASKVSDFILACETNSVKKAG